LADLAKIFLNPLFLLASPWLCSSFLPLDPSGSGVILHRGHMLRSVSSIRKLFPSFVMVIVPVLILVRRDSRQWITRDYRMHWISQCVAISYPDHFSQSGWHVSV
jgi:hypothetical protein